MKRLLVVDEAFGKSLVCLWTIPKSWKVASVVEYINAASASRSPYLQFEGQFARASEAKSWWVVECETAEKGRFAIRQSACERHENAYCSMYCQRCETHTGTRYGTIVAKGGDGYTRESRP